MSCAVEFFIKVCITMDVYLSPKINNLEDFLKRNTISFSISNSCKYILLYSFESLHRKCNLCLFSKLINFFYTFQIFFKYRIYSNFRTCSDYIKTQGGFFALRRVPGWLVPGTLFLNLKRANFWHVSNISKNWLSLTSGTRLKTKYRLLFRYNQNMPL